MCRIKSSSTLITVRARQDREEDLESIYSELQEKHGDSYSGPQLRLWARMIVSGTHDDVEEPPRVPIIIGMVPNHHKQETLFDALAGAATALVKGFCPTLTSVSRFFLPIISIIIYIHPTG